MKMAAVRWPGRRRWQVVLLAVVSVVGGATHSEEAWLGVLKAQLVKEKSCQLAHMVQSREVIVAGAKLREGRIRCVDGREYDFTQPSAHGKFELKACQPAVC